MLAHFHQKGRKPGAKSFSRHFGKTTRNSFFCWFYFTLSFQYSISCQKRRERWGEERKTEEKPTDLLWSVVRYENWLSILVQFTTLSSSLNDFPITTDFRFWVVSGLAATDLSNVWSCRNVNEPRIAVTAKLEEEEECKWERKIEEERQKEKKTYLFGRVVEHNVTLDLTTFPLSWENSTQQSRATSVLGWVEDFVTTTLFSSWVES